MSTTIEELRGALALQEPQHNQVASAMGVESDRAIAMIQGQMTIAQKRPRKQGDVLNSIDESCQLMPVAESAHYSFKRGGQVIEGPSIDLLRLIAAAWGNIMWDISEIERRGDESTVMVFAIDLQTNAMARRQFVVRHYRDKNDDSGQAGSVLLRSDRDVREMINNYGARSVRSCLEEIIPPYIIGAARNRCYKTIEEAAKKEPLVERLKKLVPAFASVGVTEGMLVKHLGGRALGEMLEKEYITLRNIYRSIETGAQRVEEFFEKPSVADTVAAGKQQQPAKGKAGAQHEQQPAGEQQHKKVDDPAQKPTKDGLLKEIDGCKTVEQVNALGERIRTAGLSADDLKVVKKAAGARAGSIASQAVAGGGEDAPE